MKKNFLKKLAFTMAFATAFTALSPAAGVFAAAKPSLTVGKTLTLLLGTEREEHDINVKNKVAGSKYAWSTSNKAIATVDSKGVVEGQKVGSAKVTLKITLPTKKTQTLTTNVDVKDNIKEVAINNAPEGALKVGEEFDFNRTIVSTFGGNTKAHKGAITRWEVKDIDADGKVSEKVSTKASANDSGVFVADVTGEYQIEAISFQSKAKYNEYLKSGNEDLVTARSKEVKVVVEPSIVSITQKTARKFEILFDANMKELVNKDNLVITNKAGVKQAIVKGVSFNEAGTVATVETFINLVDKEVYTVTYKELAKDFAASVGEITSVAIAGPSVVEYNKATDVDVKYYDANGIEIDGNSANLKVEIVNGQGWIDPTTNKLTLFNIGDTVTLKATYRTGKFDATWNEIVLTSPEVVVTSVESLAATTNGIKAWTIADATDSTGAFVDKSKVDYSKPVTSLPLNAADKAIFVKGVNTSNKDTFDFTFESTDNAKLIVDPNTGVLIPVTTGTVGVIAKSGNYQTVLNVAITAKAEVATFTADKNTATVSSTINQTAKFVITAKDQYQGKVGLKDTDTITRTSLSRPSGLAAATAEGYLKVDVIKGNAEVTFNSTGVADGTYTYRLEVFGKPAVISVTVRSGNPADVSSYRIVLGSNSEDVVVNKDSNGEKSIAIQVLGYDVKGVPVVDVTSDASVKVKSQHTTDSSKTGVVSGSAVALDRNTKVGTYVVTGTMENAKGDTVNLVSAAYEVKNSQVRAVVSREKVQIEAGDRASVLAELNRPNSDSSKVFKVESKANASTISFVVEDSHIETTLTSASSAGTYAVRVKTIVVTETFGGNTYTYNLDVNQVITVIKR